MTLTLNYPLDQGKSQKLFQFIPVGAFAEVQQQWDQPL